MASVAEKLLLANKHLRKVEVAWDPPEWSDLSLYGFYCLEAALDAACIHFGIEVRTQHWARIEAARRLHSNHGFPDVVGLLIDLNNARKSAAYGDVEAPSLDAEDLVSTLQDFVERVESASSHEKDGE